MNDILLRRTTAVVYITVAVGLLVIGLWPFSFRPANNVKWLTDRNGLQFEPDGIAHDPELLPGSNAERSSDQAATYTVELWLEPDIEPVTDVFHILTIDDGQLPSNFVLCQWKSYLLLRSPDAGNDRGFREVGIDALHKQKARFIAVAGDASGTAFYADGILLERFPDFVLPARRLNGKLILGDAAEGKHAWTGRLFGLATFNRALDATEVAQHYVNWTNAQTNRLVHESGLTALFLFDERTGPWANDSSPRKHRLFIPSRYQALHKLVFALPHYDDSHIGSNLRDIAVNIIGFVPFGFCAWHFRRTTIPARPITSALFAVSAGAALSLTIEFIQDSGCRIGRRRLWYLACNTLGTILGVLLAMLIWLRRPQRG